MIDALMVLVASLGIAVVGCFACIVKLKSDLNEVYRQQKRIREALVIQQKRLDEL